MNELEPSGGSVQQQHRSWSTLVGTFVLTTFAWSLVVAAVLAGAAVVIAGGAWAQTPDEQISPAVYHEYSGVITDARCGPKHSDAEKGASECARMCVRNGSRYTVVDGERKYEVEGNLSQFDDFAGQRVNLSGVLDGNTLKVISISSPVVAQKK